MYCPSCGTKIPDASPVCPTCSASTSLGTYDDAVDRALERHRKITKLSHEAAAARKAANQAKEEHRRLAWRFKSCGVVTLILTAAWMAFMACAAAYASIDLQEIYETSWTDYGVSATSVSLFLLGCLAVALLACITFMGSIAYGTPPVIDFIKRSGFSIWGSVFVLIVAGAIVFLVITFVGFPYFFHLVSKVSLTKKEAAKWEKEAVRLENALAAC